GPVEKALGVVKPWDGVCLPLVLAGDDRVWEELAHVGVERIKRSDPAGLGELGGIGDVRLEHIWGTRAGDETLLELLQICSGVGREHLDRDFDVRVCLFEGTDGYLRLLALGAQTGLREDDR